MSEAIAYGAQALAPDLTAMLGRLARMSQGDRQRVLAMLDTNTRENLSALVLRERHASPSPKLSALISSCRTDAPTRVLTDKARQALIEAPDVSSARPSFEEALAHFAGEPRAGSRLGRMRRT